MKDILTMKQQVQLTILETFIEEQQVTLQQLEKKTGATKQTIIKWIKELENHTTFFQVKKQHSQWYLQSKMRINHQIVYNYFYQHAIQLQLIEYIFLHPFTTTANILQTFDLSYSKFRNIKKQLINALRLYDISISNSPFCFTGDFNKLCRFFILFLSEKYYFVDEYILPKEQVLMEQILQSFTSLPLIFPNQQQVKSWIWVIIKLSAHFPKLINATIPFNSENCQIIVNYEYFKNVFNVSYTGLVQMKLAELYSTLKKPILSSKMKQKKEALRAFSVRIYQLFGESQDIKIPPIIDLKLALSYMKEEVTY
ncbi:helix-turn-helix domain-containing protein [Enterococcus ratti]|uniref:helix-turn-helix domain-containing protein n=1 Tax=Enterococcus ratti TaxID=150033 RepID=UPI003517F46D